MNNLFKNLPMLVLWMAVAFYPRLAHGQPAPVDDRATLTPGDAGVPGQSIDQMSQGKFQAIPLPVGRGSHQRALNEYGVPFLAGSLPLSPGGSATVKVGGPIKRIYLLGMTESPFIGAWADPTNYSVRCFFGDQMGQIQLNYADGTTQAYPLVMGESLWWGQAFNNFPEPYPSSARFRKALASSLQLYPPTPVRNGQYVAVISPSQNALESITVSSSPAKKGTPVITGITVETVAGNDLAGTIAVSPWPFSPPFKKFIKEKNLQLAGAEKKASARALENLRLSFYTSDADYGRRVALQTPAGYTGPQVTFKGGLTAEILENVFSYNVQDIADKIDEDGMYHTSTRGAVLWGRGGGQFGSYATNAGCYYADSWTRDMGRSLQELTILGYTNDALHCADYCLRVAKLWEKPNAPKYYVNGDSNKGELYPPHWSRVANGPGRAPPFENDGHGLVCLFLYKLWQRLPDRDDWLRARWPDIKDAGDWVVWELDHPEISGATNGVLHTTGESAGGNGYSVYGDYSCMIALRALAQMADSIGQTDCADKWRLYAAKMKIAMGHQYLIDDPKYGRVWTLDHAGWPTHPTVLGPIIFRADYQGFSPEEEDDDWHTMNEAAYQRLIDAYQPFGFYGDAMGYGQGFVTESALLLDRMRDVTPMLDWTAKQIYDPKLGFFIVPEGVQIDPTGKFWYRAGDLGNGVQEAEIVKVLRLVIGVDDTHPDHLQFYPRMPYHWYEMAVAKYPVLFEDSGKMENTFLHYKLRRSGQKMKLEIAADHSLGPVAMRLGPFAKPPNAADILVNGKSPARAAIAPSGDSWWVSFTAPVGNGT
jgi:hypothetical protein